jgi:hypothetical protein
MTRYILPEARMIARARHGIDEVRHALIQQGRGHWRVYSIRATEVHPEMWVLYVVSQSTSMPLTRELAAGLSMETVWLAGRQPGRILSIDFSPDGDVTDAIYAIEVLLVISTSWPPEPGRPLTEGACPLIAAFDARQGATVQLTFALPRRPLGWPP